MLAFHNVQLAYLEDVLFENLPFEKAKKWHELFLNSITVGADLPLVFSKFIVRVLGDSERGCVLYAGTPDSEVAINLVIKLYERKIEGDVVSAEEWALARRTAYAAAYDAAANDSAAYAAATAADEADAASVAVAAVYAAGAAKAAARAAVGADDVVADDVVADAARAIHYEWMFDVLIKELKNARV